MVRITRSRARPRVVWLVGFLVSVAAAGPDALLAQVPEAAADSLRPDTVQIPIPPQDFPPDTLPDSLQAAAEQEVQPEVPVLFPTISAGGWSTATWEWSRDQLLAIPAMTALEFIERLPGVTRFRAGNFGRPEGITAMGMGGARTRVFLDGFELDPFGSGAFELETLPLLELASVRVERSLMEIRVDVRTYQLDQPDAHSVVELGTGVYKTRLLRALFSRGIGSKSTFTGSYDLVNTQGIGIDEPYSHGGNAVRWTYVPLDRLSVQAEWRRSTIDRERTDFPTQTSRSELLLRVRSPLTSSLTVEGFAGRVSLEEEVEEAEAERKSVQGGVRAAFSNSALFAEASGRFRSATSEYPLLPGREVEGSVGVAPTRLLRVEGSGRIASWDGGSSSSAQLKGVVSPAEGVSIFGSLEAGSRPLTGFEAIGPDTVATLVASDGGGWRGGAELARRGASAGVALFGSSVSSIAPFGLAFDREILSVDAEPVTGVELYGRLPLWRAISIEGWYSRIDDAEDRPYTPRDIGRVILSATGSYYSDQLEPTLLIEGIHRGSALVPGVEGTGFGVRSDPYQLLDLSLRIRIIDVEAYLLWNNLLANRAAIDMPGAPPAIQRIVYGARWSFRG